MIEYELVTDTTPLIVIIFISATLRYTGYGIGAIIYGSHSLRQVMPEPVD